MFKGCRDTCILHAHADIGDHIGDNFRIGAEYAVTEFIVRINIHISDGCKVHIETESTEVCTG